MADWNDIKVTALNGTLESVEGKALTIEVNGQTYAVSAPPGGGLIINAVTTMNTRIAVRPLAHNSIEVYQP